MNKVFFIATVLMTIQLQGCDVLKDDESTTNNECSADKQNTPNAEQAGASLIQTAPKLSDAIPFQKWEKLGATTEGILFASGTQSWGESFDHGGYIGIGTTRKEYKYAANGFSPYALYFPSGGEGFNYITNWQVDTGTGKAVFNAAMFDPTTTNSFGLSAAAHIVRLGVNSGAGGGGIHFVATTTQVIDGTADAPLNPVTTITEAKTLFDTFLVSKASEKRDALAKALGDLTASHIDAPKTAAEYTEKLSKAMLPNWYAANKQLHIVFVEKSEADFTKTVVNENQVECPDGAPCAMEQPNGIVSFHYEVSFGVQYIFDASGTLVSETPLEIDSKFSDNSNNFNDKNVSDEDVGYDEVDQGIDKDEGMVNGYDSGCSKSATK